jgi:hypothetical protein
MSAARGEVEMTITSASPLDAKVVKQLENAVSKSQFVGQGKKLKVVPKVCHVKQRRKARSLEDLDILLTTPARTGQP